jgi:hypothetical protein
LVWVMGRDNCRQVLKNDDGEASYAPKTIEVIYSPSIVAHLASLELSCLPILDELRACRLYLKGLMKTHLDYPQCWGANDGFASACVISLLRRTRSGSCRPASATGQ